MPPQEIPSDAHLAQLVRGSLGTNIRRRGEQRLNVSSCSNVVTLHGVARDADDRLRIEEVVRRIPGVVGVVNKLVLGSERGR